MSNIVAMALCRIKDSKNLEYNKDTGADNTYTLYSSMCEILCESADRFIPGDWEFEIIENSNLISEIKIENLAIEIHLFMEKYGKNVNNLVNILDEVTTNDVLIKYSGL